MTCLLENEIKPFNILLCQDVYFSTHQEFELTLEMLKRTKDYLKMKVQEMLHQNQDQTLELNPGLKTPGINGKRIDFIEKITYLTRFFIGNGRICLLVSNLVIPMSIPKVEKNTHYNIDVS